MESVKGKNSIQDWNGKDIDIIVSKGGIIATKNAMDNLIIPKKLSFLPIEIVQKSYKSNHAGAFDDVKNYSDIQSINSEDAMVWSYFSHLVYGGEKEKYKFTNELFEKLGISLDKDENIEYFLWRRIPHPETFVSGGPEIDFGIITDNNFILGEAKWKSDISRNQGKEKNKSQLELREEFLETFNSTLLGGFNKKLSLLVSNEKTSTESNSFMSWEELVKLKSHPIQKEIERYYSWKIKYGK